MKKIALLVLVIITSMSSCSKDDENVSAKNLYVEIKILGETHKMNRPIGELSIPVYNCSSNAPDDLKAEAIVEFEKSNFSLMVHFIHYESQSNFKDYNLNATAVISDPEISGGCFNNLDLGLSLVYEDDWDNNFDNSSNNFNKINKISILEEDSMEIIYVVEGVFEVTFIDSNNTSIPVSGNYKIPIYVLK